VAIIILVFVFLILSFFKWVLTHSRYIKGKFAFFMAYFLSLALVMAPLLMLDVPTLESLPKEYYAKVTAQILLCSFVVLFIYDLFKAKLFSDPRRPRLFSKQAGKRLTLFFLLTVSGYMMMYAIQMKPRPDSECPPHISCCTRVPDAFIISE
jgi:hypothetical protein